MADIKATSAITIVDMSDSRSIIAVDVEYYQSTSSSSLVGGSWSTTAPTWVNGQYIWSKVKTTYSSGDPTYTDAVCITGQAGQTGEIGRGVASIVGQYAISSSKTVAPSDTSFSTEMPTWTPGNYIWSRSLITYTSGSPATSTTMPVVSSEWEAVNEIQVGGVNYVPNSATLVSINRTYKGFTMSKTTADFANMYVTVSFEARSVEEDGLPKTCQVYFRGGTATSVIGDQTITDQWARYSKTTFVTQAEADKNNTQIAFHFNTPDEFSGEIRKIKVEVGNKATDWTPAPEDIDAAITENTSRIIDVELRTTEDAIVGTVRSHQDYYLDLSSRVLSETYESKMSMLDGEIALKASEQSVSDLETRVSTAEQILTSDSITSLVRTSNEYKMDMQNVADEITTVQTALGNKADASALANYATTALVNEIRETEISQRNESIEFAVSAEMTRAMGVEGEIKTFTDRAKTYFVFDLDGLTLGKEDSPFKALLGNEKLSFMQNGVEVAYIQYNRLYISVAEIMDMLTLGKATSGYTDIKTTKYGNEGGISGVWRAN